MPPAPIKISQCFWGDYLASQEAKLPALADIEDVSDRVVRVMGGNPGAFQLQGTNTYLVGTGTSRILIDTGQGKPAWIKTLTALLHERGLMVSHVLLTHWHGDHVGGVPDLLAYDKSLEECVYKHQPDPGQNDIADGQVFETEGATLRAIHTPGHAADHMCFVLEEENALFTGDNVLGHGYSVVEDLGTYVKSLHKMEDLECAIGYPAHGLEIATLPLKMQACIRHKEIREAQIYSALCGYRQSAAASDSTGSLTIRELVNTMYGDVPEDAYTEAVEPFITEVLWKLAEDRKVGFELQAGCKRWFAHLPTRTQNI